MNSNIKKELITLCKSELSKLIQEEQTKLNKSNQKLIKKILKIVKQKDINQSKMSENSNIELRRNTPAGNKFINVITERDSCGKGRAEITAYDPQIQLTLLNSNNHLINISQCELASGILKTQNSVNESSLESTKCNNDNGESIISTCEEHLTTKIAFQILQQSQLKKLKPKLTSSTTSLIKLVNGNSKNLKQKILNKIVQKQRAPSMTSFNANKEESCYSNQNKSMTFNVDYASTPKRHIPRSSTPKLLKKSSKTLEKKSTLKNQHYNNQPFSSTVLSNIANDLFQLKHSAKTIPPPLLSSSLNNDECSIQIDFNRLKYKIKNSNSKKTKTESSCKKCERIKRKRHNTDDLVDINNCCSKQSVQKKLKYESSVQPLSNKKVSSSLKQTSKKLSWRNLKYPIKYYPNMKSKDINRLNTCEQVCNTLAGSYECQLKPVLKNSYSYGDYNVWIL